MINKFLNKKFCNEAIPSGDIIYFILPYIGSLSISMKNDLLKVLKKYYCNYKFELIFINKFRMRSLFNFKDALPIDMRANIIYEFSSLSAFQIYFQILSINFGSPPIFFC